jgi:hypothetical protein
MLHARIEMGKVADMDSHQQYEQYIKAVLRESEGTGSFSETVDFADGTKKTYRFSWATGMSWSMHAAQYKSRFGDFPSWVLLCHPYHRNCLCRLALSFASKLPDSRPDPHPDDEQVFEKLLTNSAPIEKKRSSRRPKEESINDVIRSALQVAIKEEEAIRPFNLYGRGHEDRLTIDRRLAQVIRGIDVPSVKLSGYGGREYSKRVFERAANQLRKELGSSPIKFYDNSKKAYLGD